jgi:hypothetical protein
VEGTRPNPQQLTRHQRFKAPSKWLSCCLLIQAATEHGPSLPGSRPASGVTCRSTTTAETRPRRTENRAPRAPTSHGRLKIPRGARGSSPENAADAPTWDDPNVLGPDLPLADGSELKLTSDVVDYAAGSWVGDALASTRGQVAEVGLTPMTGVRGPVRFARPSPRRHRENSEWTRVGARLFRPVAFGVGYAGFTPRCPWPELR